MLVSSHLATNTERPVSGGPEPGVVGSVVRRKTERSRESDLLDVGRDVVRVMHHLLRIAQCAWSESLSASIRRGEVSVLTVSEKPGFPSRIGMHLMSS